MRWLAAEKVTVVAGLVPLLDRVRHTAAVTAGIQWAVLALTTDKLEGQPGRRATRTVRSKPPPYPGDMSEQHVIANGAHVAGIVPSGELDRLRETIEVLSDSDLVRELTEGLSDARAGWYGKVVD